ncbi:MAG: HAD family hydrolase [Acidiferrobacteraceae bacterium]
MTRPFDVIVFDWDGTLVDSAKKICRCIGAAATDCGIPDPGFEQSRQIIGLGLTEALEALFPGIPPTERARIAARYRHYYLGADATATPLFPGVPEGLAALHAAGFRMAVATGKSRRGLTRAFAETGIGGFFEASRCADESRSKPDPLMLEELLALSGVSRDRIAMVGDTSFDMEMAANAGVARFAVTYGAHARERLLDYSPIACFDSFPELSAYLAGHGGRRDVRKPSLAL